MKRSLPREVLVQPSRPMERTGPPQRLQRLAMISFLETDRAAQYHMLNRTQQQ